MVRFTTAMGTAHSPTSDATFLTLRRDDPGPSGGLRAAAYTQGLRGGQRAQGLPGAGGGAAWPNQAALQGLRDAGHSGQTESRSAALGHRAQSPAGRGPGH